MNYDLLRNISKEEKGYQSAEQNAKYTTMTIASRQNVRDAVLVCNWDAYRYIVSS